MKQRAPLPRKRATPRRNEGRIQHGRIKRKATDPATAEEQAHMDRIRAMPCLVTGKRPVDLHHVMKAPGKRCRRDHRFVVPLTRDYHNGRADSVHGLGSEALFLERHGIDLVAWAIREWERSCDI